MVCLLLCWVPYLDCARPPHYCNLLDSTQSIPASDNSTASPHPLYTITTTATDTTTIVATADSTIIPATATIIIRPGIIDASSTTIIIISTAIRD